MKIIFFFLSLTVLSFSLNADAVRIEIGGGAWLQTPKGESVYSNSDGDSGTDRSTEKEQTEFYAWMLIKHPIPIIPNFRLEYVSLTSIGKATGTFKEFSVPVSSDTTLILKEYDIIPYYNIFDNLSWVTLDIGIDLKVINASYEALNIELIDIPGISATYTEEKTVLIPLAYLRTRLEIPTTNIGLEGDAKYISYNENIIYDARIKLDYTLDLLIVNPGIEVGYRFKRTKYIHDDTTIDLNFSGPYAGIMIRY